VVALTIAASIYFGGTVKPGLADPRHSLAISPMPSPSVSAFTPGAVSVAGQGFLSWAILDRSTGRIVSASNAGSTSDTSSMIKAWLAADYLRLTFAGGKQPTNSRLIALRSMIKSNDNPPADALFVELGGAASIRRLTALCGLTDSRPASQWNRTVTSARDAVRMGLCLADGRAGGPRWTAWVLAQMRAVDGPGNFGVRLALTPAVRPTVAIGNGWALRDEDASWHISCLAIGRDWVLSTLARYPQALGLNYGRNQCRTVGGQLVSG